MRGIVGLYNLPPAEDTFAEMHDSLTHRGHDASGHYRSLPDGADVLLGRKPMTNEDTSSLGIDKLNIPRSDIPAVTHVDYSARIQTVHRETNPRYHALLPAFKARTGCPFLVNTSFNVRGEPIVRTPKDAIRCFMGTEIEVLVTGNCFLQKERQNLNLAIDYKDLFDQD